MDVEVRRDDLRTTRVVAGDGPVRVERFALTANNVTYGVMGDAMSYWRFFPASGDGWGRVPVWGIGEILATGQRIYGYFPMSSHATLELDDGFVDRSEQRRELPAVYNRYLPIALDEEHLDEIVLLRPLFGTSFLLEDFLRSEDGTVVLGSASSKTAYGLAFLLARADRHVVGLTSKGNVEFVESLGLYDRVVAYEDVGSFDDEPLIFVDMAADGAVRDALHGTGRVRRSVAVGATHGEEMAPGADAPPPQPELFFAPTQFEKLAAEVGPAEMQRRLAEAWAAFIGQVGDWMDVEHGSGPDDVQRVWKALVDGDVDPRRGHVLTLS